MAEKLCKYCLRSEVVKNGDRYQAPDGSLMIRTSGDGVFRDCVVASDPNSDEILIATEPNPSCIFPKRFVKEEAVIEIAV